MWLDRSYPAAERCLVASQWLVNAIPDLVCVVRWWVEASTHDGGHRPNGGPLRPKRRGSGAQPASLQAVFRGAMARPGPNKLRRDGEGQ